MQESSTIRFPRWLWIIPAIPLLLMILSVVMQSLSGPTRGTIDLGFWAVGAIFFLALVVGLVMLVIILILRIRRRISFSQPQTWLALALAFLDFAIPLSIIVILYVGLRSMGH